MSDTENEPKVGWFQRLTQGLTKSSNKLSEGISAIFVKRQLDQETLDELEELLISADLGPDTAGILIDNFSESRFGAEIEIEEVHEVLAKGIADILEPVAIPLRPDWSKKPYVVLVVGVNGAGKTTTIGKMARNFAAQGRSVMLAAGDTFRAAAVEQLQIWGRRTGAPVIAREIGSDAASLVYESLEAARNAGSDILLIDTAGRLHNKANLMAELGKITRVMQKLDAEAPHAVILVLDATTGQNAIAQVETFSSIVPVTGLVVTKLDGSAKGGILVTLADRFKLPVHAIGVGETVDDLREFDALEFGRSLMGVKRR
jgi:fused signal recognition particle receptor